MHLLSFPDGEDLAGSVTSSDHEFIFNLSFVPRLVCPSGFMLSPLGSEVMISCHVAFFRVIWHVPPMTSPTQLSLFNPRSDPKHMTPNFAR